MRKELADFAIVAFLFTSGCDAYPDKDASLPQFREACKDFEYIPHKWSAAAKKLRGEISSGAIDPEMDIELRSGDRNSGKFEQAEGRFSEIPGTYTQKFNVYYKGTFELEVRMPVIKAENSIIGFSSPKYRILSCANISGRSVQSYIY